MENYVDNELLPAWFTERMMEDQWIFGLLTTAGTIIAISQIEAIRQDASGNLWLDCDMMYNGYNHPLSSEYRIFAAPTDRLSVSINASQIIAAFELADT